MAKIAENKMQRRRLNNFFLLRACARPQRSGGLFVAAVYIIFLRGQYYFLVPSFINWRLLLLPAIKFFRPIFLPIENKQRKIMAKILLAGGIIKYRPFILIYFRLKTKDKN